MKGPALVVVRHAPVAVEGICYGQSEVPTAIDPESAAEAIRAQLEAARVEAGRVWSSPWARSRDAASALASRLGVPLAIDGRLSELSFGAWEGRAWSDMEGDGAFAAWMNDWRRAAPPGGESVDDLVSRVRGWRAEVRASGEAVVAVTHAGVIRALRADARGVDYAALVSEPVPPLRAERIA